MKQLKVPWLLIASFAVMLMAFGGAAQANDGVEFGGEVTVRGDAGFTVANDGGSRDVTVNGDTEYKYESGEAATYDDVQVGGHVYVYGAETEDGVVASKVVLKGSDPDNIVIEGKVTDVRMDGITVETEDGDKIIQTNDATKYHIGDIEVDREKLVVGVLVRVEAHAGDGDSIVADDVQIHDPADEAFRFEGKITELGDGSVTVENEEKTLTFLLTDDTEVYIFGDGTHSFRPNAHDGSVGTLDDLKVGQRILVLAIKGDNDTLIALKIGIFGDRQEKMRIIGELTFVGEDSVTVVAGDKEFHFLVTPDTLITLNPDNRDGVTAHDHEPIPGSISDLEVGMRVLVFGHKDGDNLVADRIHVLGVKEMEGIKLFGTIAEIGDGSIKLDTGDKVLDITVNDDTKIIFKGNYNNDEEDDSEDDGATAHDIHKGSLTDLQVGMRVVAFAAKDGESLIARAIIAIGDEDNFEDHLFRGIITEVGDGSFVIKTRKGNVEFTLNSNTEVSHQNGDDATFADLKVGLLVAVSAEKNEDGVWANKVIILDGVNKPERGQFELEGVVISKNAEAGTFDIRQPRGSEVTVYTDGETDFVNADGSLATFDAIVEGLFVAIEGKPQGDGLLAGEVQLFNEEHEAGIVGRTSSPNAAASAGKAFILKTGAGRKVVTASKRTVVRFQDGRTGSLANITKGTPVLVEATGKGAKLKASKITILRNRGAIVRVSAKLVKVKAGGLSVKVGRRTVSFETTPGTVVLLKSGQAVRLGKLKAGQKVLLVGYRAPGGKFVTMIRVTR